ncbi:hypothetical protein BN971_03755 [Mycobacterium bohemicum DSM 44277]|uniref:Uncharacterized protein n=1 Tax=Mycobacterium bohemicum DSM 44277 TaxID=1236609 RepID=A0A0U0WBP3_MYCBE|nr:hypothetical protein BN971_03755 [Mycobacterium bohemicum DSM 44277]
MFATRPSQSVINPASSASPTVVATVTGRLRCGAADTGIPLPW